MTYQILICGFKKTFSESVELLNSLNKYQQLEGQILLLVLNSLLLLLSVIRNAAAIKSNNWNNFVKFFLKLIESKKRITKPIIAKNSSQSLGRDDAYCSLNDFR